MFNRTRAGGAVIRYDINRSDHVMMLGLSESERRICSPCTLVAAIDTTLRARDLLS